MKFRDSFFIFWKTVTVAILILTLCLIPASSLQKIDLLKVSFEDLVVHFIMFFAFSFVLAYDLLQTHTKNKIQALFIAIVVSVFLGVTTEMLQYLLVSLNRTGNLVDFLFDLLGTAAGITMIRFIKR